MSEEANIYRCTPRQTTAFIKEVWEAGLVPNVMSSPGMGKSTIFRKNAKDFNLHLIDHRLSTSAPEDLSGLPEFITTPSGQRVATFTPFDIFPIEKTPMPEGKDGWAIFFDEFNSGIKEVQAACYKVILDKMVGQFHLHKNVVMGCAGNLMTDRAITSDLSTAMQSRLIHIEMELNFREWYEDVALAEDYDERVIAYLQFDNDALMDFRPDHQDKTFNCPRTWEFMNKLVKGKTITPDKTALYAGTITSSHAAAFVQFTEVYKEMITIEDVLRDPENAPVPARDEQQRKWAIITHLMKKTTEKNLGDIALYVNRLDLTFRIMFFRSIVHTNPALRTHPSFAKAMVELQRYLRD